VLVPRVEPRIAAALVGTKGITAGLDNSVVGSHPFIIVVVLRNLHIAVIRIRATVIAAAVTGSYRHQEWGNHFSCSRSRPLPDCFR